MSMLSSKPPDPPKSPGQRRRNQATAKRVQVKRELKLRVPKGKRAKLKFRGTVDGQQPVMVFKARQRRG
jgi:hypothetical protein